MGAAPPRPGHLWVPVPPRSSPSPCGYGRWGVVQPERPVGFPSHQVQSSGGIRATLGGHCRLTGSVDQPRLPQNQSGQWGKVPPWATATLASRMSACECLLRGPLLGWVSNTQMDRPGSAPCEPQGQTPSKAGSQQASLRHRWDPYLQSCPRLGEREEASGQQNANSLNPRQPCEVVPLFNN